MIGGSCLNEPLPTVITMEAENGTNDDTKQVEARRVYGTYW